MFATDVIPHPALVKRFVYDVLTAGHLLDASGWVLYEKTINSIIWPSGIGRLPRNVSSDSSIHEFQAIESY